MSLCPIGPRSLLPRPWAPLSDAEFAALLPWLPGGEGGARRGRRPEDLRRTLNAIFWVACSKGPWRDLPAELGKADSASRTLRRWARAGVLEPLLVKATHPDAEGSAVLQGLAWWLARTFRRMARIVSTAALGLVKSTLGLVDAWPANPLVLPDRKLSETAKTELDALGKGLCLYARRASRQARRPDACDSETFGAGVKAARAAVRAVRRGWRTVRLGVLGNRHAWKLC